MLLLQCKHFNRNAFSCITFKILRFECGHVDSKDMEFVWIISIQFSNMVQRFFYSSVWCKLNEKWICQWEGDGERIVFVLVFKVSLWSAFNNRETEIFQWCEFSDWFHCAVCVLDGCCFVFFPCTLTPMNSVHYLYEIANFIRDWDVIFGFQLFLTTNIQWFFSRNLL